MSATIELQGLRMLDLSHRPTDDPSIVVLSYSCGTGLCFGRLEVAGTDFRSKFGLLRIESMLAVADESS